MVEICKSWHIPYLNLSETPPQEIKEKINARDPKILLASIEDISSPDIQSQLQSVDVSYVALDEAQVRSSELESENQWKIRKFSFIIAESEKNIRNFSFKTPEIKGKKAQMSET